MLLGLGSSIFHPETSRIARLSSGGSHGLAQSLFQVGGNFGSALGPLAAAFIVLLQDLHRPLLELVEQSTRISKGDFSATLATKRNDELGELARSLERMRSSLRAVLARIGTEPTAATTTPADRQGRSL